MRKILLYILLVNFTSVLFAQTKSYVVTDEHNVALEFVNVAFVSAVDSSVVGGTVTNSLGTFSVQDQLPPAIIRLSAVGYKTKYFHSPYADTLRLNSSAVELQGVTIRSVRQFVTPTNTGLSINMDGNPLQGLPNISDAIKQMPLVDPVDGSILGKGSPAIYVNKRLLRDETELMRISPKDVASVEIITRPGAKYSSAVKAVIIIHTLRKHEGLAGVLSANGGWSEVGTWGSNASLSYAFNNSTILYGGASWNDNGYKQQRYYAERFNNDNTQSQTEGTYRSRSHSLTANLGASYDLNANNSVGVRYEFSRNPKMHFNSESTTALERIYLHKHEQLAAIEEQFSQASTHYVNAYSSNKLGRNKMIDWNTDLDYLYGENHSNASTTEMEQSRQRNIFTSADASYYLAAAKSDLSINLAPLTIETGVQFSYTHNKLLFGGTDDAAASFIANSKDNTRQALYAAYVSLSYPLSDNLSATGGVRWEHNAFDYIQNNMKIDEQSRRFTDWLPSLSLNFRHGNAAMNLAYRSTINRPSYSLLNNNYTYVSRTQWETGNPLLKSALSHTVELSYMWKNTIIQAMYIRQVRNIKTIYNYQNQDDVIIRQEINLPSYNAFALVGSQSVTLNWWYAQLQGVFFWQDLRYGSPRRSYNTPGLKLTLTNRFRLPLGFYAFVGGTWNTDGDEGTLHQCASLSLYSILYKNIKQWTFNLGYYDFANTYRNKNYINTNGVLQTENRKGGSRLLQLSVSYVLRSKKDYRGKGAANDEKERLSQY